jgi:uncharacterized coiled-coil protein SlyX
MSISNEKRGDLRNIIAKMSTQERLEMISELADSLRQRGEPPTVEQQRENLKKLMEKLETMPCNNPDDGLSGSRDHDKIIYGGQS